MAVFFKNEEFVFFKMGVSFLKMRVFLKIGVFFKNARFVFLKNAGFVF